MDFNFRHGNIKCSFPIKKIGMDCSKVSLEACHFTNPGSLGLDKVTMGRNKRMLKE